MCEDLINVIGTFSYRATIGFVKGEPVAHRIKSYMLMIHSLHLSQDATC